MVHSVGGRVLPRPNCAKLDCRRCAARRCGMGMTRENEGRRPALPNASPFRGRWLGGQDGTAQRARLFQGKLGGAWPRMPAGRKMRVWPDSSDLAVGDPNMPVVCVVELARTAPIFPGGCGARCVPIKPMQRDLTEAPPAYPPTNSAVPRRQAAGECETGSITHGKGRAADGASSYAAAKRTVADRKAGGNELGLVL